jgi:hypothetical protein
VDTLIAGQAIVKPISQLTGTVQVISQEKRDDTWGPEIEWANLKYDVTPNVAIRGGRIGAPFFMVSDFRNVGFANTWVRPPVEVYGQVPISHLNGADALLRHSFGDDTLTIQPFAGNSTFELSGGSDGKTDDSFGLNATYEMGSWTFRGGYVATKLTLTNPRITALLGGISQTAAAVAPLSPPLANQLNQLVSQLVVDKKHSSFAGVGTTYDDGQYLFQAEYTQRRTDSIIANTHAWYTTFGYHWHSLQPYFTYAKVQTDNRHQENAIPTSGLPAPLLPTLAALHGGVAYVAEGFDQNNLSIGLRWNAFKNVDFKAQFDHIKTEANDGNFFVNQTPTFSGESVNVISLAADFVF